jgi:hypothetical protein
MSDGNLLTKLGRIPRLVIYVLTLLVIIWPLFVPWNLPVAVSPEIETWYEEMEALRGTGKTVLFLHFIPPVFWGEMQHLAFSPLQHIFKMEDVRLIIAAMTPMSQPLIGQILSDISNPHGKEYGVDYCTLPFFPGQPPAAFALLADDFRGAYTVDDFGTPIDDLAVFDGINTLDDFEIVIWIEPAKWIPLAATVLHPRHPDQTFYAIAIAEGFNYVAPYIGTVYKSVMVGVRPAAELQILFGGPYTGAVSQMDAISGYHILAIILLILGNVSIAGSVLRKSGVT